MNGQNRSVQKAEMRPPTYNQKNERKVKMEIITATDLFALYLITRGRSFVHPTIAPFLLNCMIIDMEINEYIIIDEDFNLLTTDKTPVDEHHKLLYGLIEKGGGVSIKALIDATSEGVMLFQIVELLENSLQAKNFVRLGDKRDFWKTMKKVFFFDTNKYNHYLNVVKSNFFNGNDPRELVVLVAYERKLFITKRILLKSERALYKKRLTEIDDVYKKWLIRTFGT